MHFIYIDDSTDRPHNAFSAISIPHERWSEAFDYVKKWRQHLKDVHGIPLNYELHATNFLSGRGSDGRLTHLSRHTRALIFHKHFAVVDYMFHYQVRIFNVCNGEDNQFKAFERLLNRINRTMSAWGTYGHLICDEGKERQYTRLVRKMKVYNPIPSKFGVWDDGSATKNIPLDRIIEDPQFKKSENSYFIQLADFVAMGLLRREVPTPSAKRRRITKSFDQLAHTVVTECNPKDTMGIIR
jgi:hypothetical protein